MGLYAAVIECEPASRLFLAQVAVFPVGASGTLLQSAVAPSTNVTLPSPSGSTPLVTVLVTVAVNVTAFPYVLGDKSVDTTVVVAALLTVSAAVIAEPVTAGAGE